MKHAFVLGAAVGLLLLAVLPPGNFSVDGTSMIAVAESLVTRGALTVSPELGTPGADGRYYSAWYPLASVLAVPFVLAGLTAGRLFGLPGHYLAIVCALVLPALLTAATSSFVYLLALRLGAQGRAALLAALSYVLGTIALVYARTFFAEPLLALLFVSAIYFTLRGSRMGVLLGSVLAGLALLAKPAGIVLAPLLAGYLLMKRYPCAWTMQPILGGSAGVLLYIAYNIVRFGSLLSFGQPWAFSVATLPEGLAGLLVSPGRGLVWYSPVALPGLVGIARLFRQRALRHEAGLLALTVVAVLLLHAAWTFWHGGRTWGPRFLLPAIPVLLACGAVLEKPWRGLLVGLAIAGFVVNAPTLVVFYERYELMARREGRSTQELLWSPAHAPFLHIWPAAYEQARDAHRADVRSLVKEAGTPEEQGQLLRVVALWWWMLPVVQLPRWPGAAAMIVATSLSLSMMYRLYRSTTHAPSAAGARS